MFDLERLTVIPGKLQKYWDEPGDFLATGIDVAERVHGGQLPKILSRLAVLVLQPEAIAGRKVETCLSFLREHGYRVLLALPFRLTVPASMVVWQFQSNVFTADSKAIRQAIYTRGTSLMLVLEDTLPFGEHPASSRLALLKGSPDPTERSRGNLRTRLGAMNKLFGLVHCPDEPLDILRELAIMLAEPELSEVHTQLADVLTRGVDHDCEPEIDSLYRETPEHDFDPGRALHRLLTGIAESDPGGPRGCLLSAFIAEASLPDHALDWFMYVKWLRELGIDPHDWDPLIVASGLIENTLPGLTKLIPSFTELMPTSQQ